MEEENILLQAGRQAGRQTICLFGYSKSAGVTFGADISLCMVLWL